ncbi:MAG TPA: DinB family protein [Turneriella sp.]|nr:DinB family protein [Turneriella sp.]HNM99491.1 DinB family protein [Turneriella sp.]
MLKDNFTRLSKYNRVMNQRVYEAAEKLPDEIRKKDLGAFFHSIHATLNHLLWADQVWLRRFALAGYGGRTLSADLFTGLEQHNAEYGRNLYENFETLKNTRQALDNRFVEWVLDDLSDEMLLKNLNYTNNRQQSQTQRFSDVLAHLFNHQTHHRGQVTTLLCQQGIDPGWTDYIYYCKDF